MTVFCPCGDSKEKIPSLNSFFPCKKKLKRDTNVTCGTVTHEHAIGPVLGVKIICPLYSRLFDVLCFLWRKYFFFWNSAKKSLLWVGFFAAGKKSERGDVLPCGTVTHKHGIGPVLGVKIICPRYSRLFDIFFRESTFFSGTQPKNRFFELDFLLQKKNQNEGLFYHVEQSHMNMQLDLC